MSNQPEQLTASYYFNVDNIMKALNIVVADFGYYLNADTVSYLVNETADKKREDFRNFIRHGANVGVAIDAILVVLLSVGFLKNQESIEMAVLKQEELLTSFIRDGHKAGYDDSSEESYW